MKSFLLTTTFSVIMLASACPGSAQASNGALDFLDPCVGVTDNFRSARDSALAHLDQAVAGADSMPVPAEYREAWMEDKKKALRPMFDEQAAPVLRQAGVTDLEKAYDIWFMNQLATFGQENVEQAVAVNFHLEAKQEALQQRTEGRAQLAQDQHDLEKSCKMDPTNRILRGALTAALAPVSIVQGNFESAKKEHGIVAQAIHASTGVGVTDIFKHGPLGGHNSEPRKLIRRLGLPW